jgi:ABC-2 type transport system ATP-binding protein
VSEERTEAPLLADEIQEPAIRVEGLQKSYKELHVLRGVDFDVARGGIFALLGSNGAGKTTVVKILATLLRADAGSVTIGGFDVAFEPARVRESISLTGQFAAVDEILTGRENLVMVARLRHLADAGAIADDLLERFALTDAGARRTSTYSGGMRRRLDPEGRLEVWRAIKELAGQGTTVLLTTQHLEEAEHLADRIAILHDGREENNSIAIASNESFSGWTKTFTDPRLCAAIVDRLTFNGTIIETGTDSYRLAHTRQTMAAAE